MKKSPSILAFCFMLTCCVALIANEASRTALSDPDIDKLKEAGIEILLELPPQPEKEEKISDSDTISVDFPDEKIATIIRNVADLYGLNLAMPSSLSSSGEKISIKLDNVTWRELFTFVLDYEGYTWRKENNIVYIGRYDKEMIGSYTDVEIRLNRLDYSDVEPLIQVLEKDNLVRVIRYSKDDKKLNFKSIQILSFSLIHIIERMDRDEVRSVRKQSSIKAE